jgi:hypothetical protein
MRLEDIDLIENSDTEGPEYYEALQRAINDGQAWKLQGSYGRAMMRAIEAGMCMLGQIQTTDYWGNRIPSRTEVQEGTKGSRQFVADCQGEEWAARLERYDA